MNAAAAAARLFFAVWPEPHVQEALYEVARRHARHCGGRAIACRKIHLTLAFLGNVEPSRMALACRVATGLAGAHCDLVLDRVRYWRHNRIVWAGSGETPAALGALAVALCGALREAGFTLEERPFVPHVTLLRNARRGPVDGAIAPAIRWPVREFALIESVARGGEREYESRERFALAG